MSTFANLCIFASLIALLFQRVRTLLTYFQQEEYDRKRFVSSLISVRLFDIKASVATLIAAGLGLLGFPSSLATFSLALAFAILAYLERSYRYKKALVMTERAFRLFRLTLVALGILSLAIFLNTSTAILVLQIAPFALIAANEILKPLQTRINKLFEVEASDKLERLNPVRIGITGSFGKTTVKHMFAEILQASGPVFFSPGSINTILGHSRHIRQRLQWSHKHFVAEMGAYGIGSIQSLCDFIRPQYGIVTAVGDAHTERFGSLDAIAQAKSELAADICSRNGTVVLNADLLKYEPFRRIWQNYQKFVVTVGPDNADVQIESHELDGGSWAIHLRSEDPRFFDISYNLPLIGDHNVMNSALAVTLAQIVDPSIADQIPLFTRTISQIPHRLQKVNSFGSTLILDDAYNSNEMGFKSAVSAMNKLAEQRGGRRIIVTPGIAELGLEHDRVHDRLGLFCAKNCDLIYVVNPERIKSFAKAAQSGSAKVIEVPRFMAARAIIAKDQKEQDVILYENDLPDLLEKTRLL